MVSAKVGDGSIASLLAQTGIDFSTSNVAKLLQTKLTAKLIQLMQA